MFTIHSEDFVHIGYRCTFPYEQLYPLIYTCNVILVESFFLFIPPGMEFTMLLLCTFGQTNAVFRLHQTLTFAQLVHGVCDKFDGLDPTLLYFFFTIPGYSKFKVDCDDDVQKMFPLRSRLALTIWIR